MEEEVQSDGRVNTQFRLRTSTLTADLGHPGVGQHADNNRATFFILKKQREQKAIYAFVDVVRAYHTYFDRFLKSNNLNANPTPSVADTWKLEVFKDVQRSGVHYEHYQKEEEKVVNNFIWYVLVERFELFSSIVYSAFNTIVGGGSGDTSKSNDEFVSMGVMSAMFPLFQRLDTSRPMEQLARLGSVKDDFKATHKNAIISEIASIH
jgi:hypothetical protein